MKIFLKNIKNLWKYSKEENYIEELTKIRSGTMSKIMKELEAGFVYGDGKYVKRYMIIKDIDDKKVLRYKLETMDQQIHYFWNKNKPVLLASKFLNYGEMCIVSPYMYIFKLNTVVKPRKDKISESTDIRFKNSISREDLNTSKKEYRMKELKKRQKKVIFLFKEMIMPQYLFDITIYKTNKVIVCLNNNADDYILLFKNFFGKGS